MKFELKPDGNLVRSLSLTERIGMAFDALFDPSSLRSRIVQDQHVSLSDGSLFTFGNTSASGVNVTEMRAMQSSVVFACVRVLSESVAMLPWHLYRRLPKGKERATDHPLYRVLRHVANPEMSAFMWAETMMVHLTLWGNHYSEIEMNNRGEIRALWPLRPDRMRVYRLENGDLAYEYTLPNGTQKLFPKDLIFHARGMGNGVMGLSPIAFAREAIGLSIAAEQFGSSFFGNGARPGGVLQYPGKLTDAVLTRIKNSWADTHQGLTNAQRVSVLEEGMTYKEIGIPPDDAQFLETRKFQTVEICRFYRMPPHMIQDLEHATYSNIEEQGINYVTNTVGAWLVRLEQESYIQLLSRQEQEIYFSEFLRDALLMGNTQARYTAYSIARQWGWFNVDEIRERENMNPLPDGKGAEYLVPLNMIGSGQIGTGNDSQKPATQSNTSSRAAQILIQDACHRIDARAKDRDLKHQKWMMDVLSPLFVAFGDDALRSVTSAQECVEHWMTHPEETSAEFSQHCISKL